MLRKLPLLHILLFLLTICTTLWVGAVHKGVDVFSEPWRIYEGFPFSATLMVVLMAHEFSHYFASRKHKVEASLPYFIPAPTLFGTLGAVIKMKSPIYTRDALIDIGASGPIAGFIVSIVASVIGLYFSKVIPITQVEGAVMLGDSLLFKLFTRLVLGNLPEHSDILLHPVAFAGWIGFFITSLNLIPVGQLDGGHILYALMGARHNVVSTILIGLLVLFGILFWQGWLVWAVLLLIIGFKHPPVVYEHLPLDGRRRMLGWITVCIFFLTFTPVPISI